MYSADLVIGRLGYFISESGEISCNLCSFLIQFSMILLQKDQEYSSGDNLGLLHDQLKLRGCLEYGTKDSCCSLDHMGVLDGGLSYRSQYVR